MPQILLRHHWSRASIFLSFVAVRDHVSLPYKKIDKMRALYSFSFKSKGSRVPTHSCQASPYSHSTPSDGQSPTKVVNTSTRFMGQRSQIYELRDAFDNLTLHHNIPRTWQKI